MKTRKRDNNRTRTALELEWLDDELIRLRSENAELRLENSRLNRELDKLNRQVEKLEEQNRKLATALENSRRAGKRQAAPFRKDKKSGEPKKPGRKPGDDYGEHARRPVPSPDEITERYDVPLPDCCPECQCADIHLGELVHQYQVEIPAAPIYREFVIQTGTCPCCGKALRGRHELQTSDATGAAGVQLGARAHAAMAWLNKRAGMSHGKIQLMFGELFGISISRSTSARSCQRTAARCAPAVQQIAKDVRNSWQVTPDETGWRVGGEKAWLHAFATPNETFYVIHPTRSGQPLEDLLGIEWSGHLVHDGWSPYNRFSKATHQQCNAHLINRCNELLETLPVGAAQFPHDVKDLLQRGLDLRHRFVAGEVSPHGLLVMAGRLTNELLGLVGRRKRNADNERLASFLFEHHDEIFTYLRHPGWDATNWRGEHAMRYGVVNRKVWGGNREWSGGAGPQAVLMSVIQTCVQRLLSPISFLVQVLTSPGETTIPPPSTR